MRLAPAAALAALALASCGGPASERGGRDGAGRCVIAPGEGVGPVRRGVSEARLVKQVGARFVSREDLPLGEGMSEPGTVLWPEDPARRLEVRWTDPGRTRPAAIVLRAGHSACATADGIGIGTRLSALVERNRGPIDVLGFGWDYAGTVASFRGGALEARLGRERGVVLRLGPRNGDDTLEAELLGSDPFPSDHPALAAMDPAVYELVVELP